MLAVLVVLHSFLSHSFPFHFLSFPIISYYFLSFFFISFYPLLVRFAVTCYLIYVISSFSYHALWREMLLFLFCWYPPYDDEVGKLVLFTHLHYVVYVKYIIIRRESVYIRIQLRLYVCACNVLYITLVNSFSLNQFYILFVFSFRFLFLFVFFIFRFYVFLFSIIL